MSDENRERVEAEEELPPLKIRDVMVQKVVAVDENSSVKAAVDVMNKFQIGSLIVLGNGKAKGIVTERDFLKRVIAEGKDAANTKVKDIMSSPLIFLGPDADLEKAVNLMFEHQIKKLAIINADKLVGIVTLTDIARVHPRIIKMLKELAAEQEMTKSMQKVIHYYIV